jgi:major membrane immunogen (membrane-anchored lipoprotein)
MWGNIVAIHNVLKKKTTKLNSQPAQYEKNKIDKDNSGKQTKKIIKQPCGETL